ncbi:MAG: hypothetical protein NTW17_02690 [Candidatus Pacearchaeota archaeon]|nr:hypothetical protein [Candidatus Pacearchaeota archaeon]
MTNYIGQALREINPCGIEGRPNTQCKYARECTLLGKQSGRFLCLSAMGYQVANYLIQGSPVEIERRDLREHVASQIGITVIDPRKEAWEPTKLNGADIRKVVDEMVAIGQSLTNRASAIGSDKDPLNFDCSVENIVADL